MHKSYFLFCLISVVFNSFINLQPLYGIPKKKILEDNQYSKLPLYLHIQKLQEIICLSGQARRMAEEKRVFVKEQELPSQRPNIKKVDVKI